MMMSRSQGGMLRTKFHGIMQPREKTFFKKRDG
jgi:hypothetical protein